MTLYIIGALVLWLIAGVIVGMWIGSRVRDAEMVDRERLMQ